MEKLKNEQLHCPFCNGEMHLKSSNYVGMNIFYLNFLCTGCAAYLSFKVKSRASSTEEIEELAFGGLCRNGLDGIVEHLQEVLSFDGKLHFRFGS